MTVDLSEFDELNKRKKVPWEERAALIKEKFPSTDRLDWNKALSADIDLFGRIVRDILKMDLSTAGRPGPRSNLDLEPGTARLKQYMGVDYSLDPFDVTLCNLAESTSPKLTVRGLAAKTGLNRSQVHRLMTGTLEPDLYAMQAVAAAFKKHPSFFKEYRARWIASALLDRCEAYPDLTISMFRRLKEAEAEGDRP